MFDTSTNAVDYELCISGGEYRLGTAGTMLLTGPLRDYSAFGQPYDWPEFLFLGDDTSSAGARVAITRIEAEALTATPPALGNSLRLSKTAPAIAATVDPAPGAVRYDLWRDGAKTAIRGTRYLDSTTGIFLDTISPGDGASWWFAATARDSCGREFD